MLGILPYFIWKFLGLSGYEGGLIQWEGWDEGLS